MDSIVCMGPTIRRLNAYDVNATCARRSKLRRFRKAYVRRKFTPHKAGVCHVKVWAREQRRILRCLRKSYVNGAGGKLRSRRTH